MKKTFIVSVDLKSKEIKRDCWDFYIFDALFDTLIKDEEQQKLEFKNLSVKEVQDVAE